MKRVNTPVTTLIAEMRRFVKEGAACQGQRRGDSSITRTYHNIVRVEGTHAQ